MNNAELFKKVFGIYAEEFWAYPKEDMLDWIASDVPTADVVDVVRCEDCNHWDTSWEAHKGVYYCR